MRKLHIINYIISNSNNNNNNNKLVFESCKKAKHNKLFLLCVYNATTHDIINKNIREKRRF